MSILTHLLRTLVAFVASLLVVFVLVIGVELLSNVLYPLPSDFSGNHEQVCLHVSNYPAWVLTIVVVAWGLTASIGTWLARRIGNGYAAILIGLLLVAAVGLNLSMLPYPIWFKVAVAMAVPVACVLGAKHVGTID